MEFKEFNLHPDLQRGIEEAGYITCMPVQEQVMTRAFGGQDMYVQSQTGTGKTAAFLVVIFHRLLTEDLLAGKKALIMAPTRELAVQIEEETKLLGKYLPFKVGSFYGGVGYTQQEKLLKENVQIMVGTPGRVLDLNKSGKMNLMDIAFLVLDEADRMFDMGFYPDLRKLIKVVPPVDRRQTMLFSATLNAWVKNLAWEYTRAPVEIDIEPEMVTVEEIDQVLYHVPSEEKMKLLLGILEREQPESAIIFCNTKRYTEIVAKRLRMNGYTCEFIMGDLPQSRRLKVIEDVKAGKTKILVATDVAARGLDIEGLAMVVNYDLPVEAENYVHRIGRTARAGKSGRAITLASEQDVYELPAIERYIGKKIPSEIAAPELHADDKSAGQRVYTEFYEERHAGTAKPHHRGGGAPRSGGASRSSSRSGGVSRTGVARTGAPRSGTPRDHDRGSGTSRSPAPNKPGAGHHGHSASRNSGAGQAAGQDLSQMTFEERMAMYRQKYNSSGKAPSGKAPDTVAVGVPPSARHKPHKPKGSSSAPAKGARPQQPKPPKPPKPKQQRPPKQQPEKSTPVKKGVFSRLLGMFKKK